MDDYILDSVYSVCQNKTKISLILYDTLQICASMQDLLYYAVSGNKEIPTDRTNLLRSSLFNLFPNLVELHLWVNDECRLNLLSLLSVLDELVVPLSFIKISDTNSWLKDAFASIPDLTAKYAAKKWDIEYRKVQEKDWIFIKQKL